MVSSKTSGELLAKTRMFQWHVERDSFISCQNGDCLVSPIFSFKNLDWKLLLHPKYVKEGECYSSLFLKCVNIQNEISVHYAFSLLNKDGERVKFHKHNKTFMPGTGTSWGSLKWIQQSFILDLENKIFKDDKLTILCYIVVEEKTLMSEIEVQDQKNSWRLKEFDKFEELLNDKDFSDVTITAQGKNFYLHKCILSVNSVVFKAMFTNNMKEKIESVVTIEDISYEILQEFFRFIYTGKVNDLEKIVEELLVAAEKYCIEELKGTCEDTMCRYLSKNNAISYLKLGILNNAEKLLTSAIECVSLYLEFLIDTEEFENFGNQHPDILLEIMKKHIGM